MVPRIATIIARDAPPTSGAVENEPDVLTASDVAISTSQVLTGMLKRARGGAKVATWKAFASSPSEDY